MHPIPRLAPLLIAAALAACASRPSALPAVAIGAVQGSSERSPLEGREVVVEGVVTADFSAGLGRWVLQGAGDGDAATSDAVFLAGADPALAVGAHLRVRGSVAEHAAAARSTVTVIELAHVLRLADAPSPAPHALTAVPADSAAWEALEAMRVSLPSTTLVATHNAARWGEWQVALGGRAWTPTEVALPGAAANALATGNRARMLWLDDGDNRADAATALQREIPRAGSVLAALTGIVDERAGRHRVQLAARPDVAASARPSPPPRVGEVRIAAMNVENLFNGDGRGGGFPTTRGARTQADYLAQRGRIVATLAALDADIVALMELENDGGDALSSEAQLLAALNAVHGGDWRAVAMPANASTDAIRVGLVYRGSKLRPVGAPATLDTGPFRDLSRPPLAQAFRAGNGPVFTVVANHFKSKGCRDAAGADADQRDGQACWNATRLESARRLDGWLRQRLGSRLDVPALILGDFNAYAMEDPARWLREAGWRDAFDEAGVAQPYSYVYDGQIGRLDHALLTPALAARLQGAAEWHANADEADAPPPAGAAPAPWRSSDHDPLVVDLRLRGR